MFDWGWRILFLLVWGAIFYSNGPIYNETDFEWFLMNRFSLLTTSIIQTFIYSIAFIPLIFKLFKLRKKNQSSKTKQTSNLRNIFQNNSSRDSKTSNNLLSTPEERLDEEKLYEFVINELKSGERREGLWTKAMVLTSGDENKIRLEYIKLRIQSLLDEKDKENKEAKEIEEKKIKNERLERRKDSFYRIRRFFGWTFVIFILFYVIVVIGVNYN